MQLSKTMPAAEFIAQKPYDALRADLASIYDSLIDRFEPMPKHLTDEGESVLCEVGSFLLNQGVAVEILRNEYSSEPDAVFVVDIAYIPDCPNMTFVGSGTKHQLPLLLKAKSFEDAVQGITDIMLAHKL